MQLFIAPIGDVLRRAVEVGRGALARRDERLDAPPEPPRTALNLLPEAHLAHTLVQPALKIFARRQAHRPRLLRCVGPRREFGRLAPQEESQLVLFERPD